MSKVEAMRWLAENRCPWCERHGRCDGLGRKGKPYAVRRTYEGWRCMGYRSRYNSDEWKAGA